MLLAKRDEPTISRDIPVTCRFWQDMTWPAHVGLHAIPPLELRFPRRFGRGRRSLGHERFQRRAAAEY